MSRGWGPAGGEVASGRGMRKKGLRNVRRLGVYVRPYRARLLGAILAMFGVLGCTLALPLLLKTAIDSAIIPGDTRLLVGIAGVVVMYDRLLHMGRFAPRPVRPRGSRTAGQRRPALHRRTMSHPHGRRPAPRRSRPSR